MNHLFLKLMKSKLIFCYVCIYIKKKKRKNLNIIQQYKLLRNEIIVQFVLCEVNVKFDWYIFVTDNFTFL